MADENWDIENWDAQTVTKRWQKHSAVSQKRKV